MNEQMGGPRAASGHRAAEEISDDPWRTELVLRLRHHDVRAAQIGEALAEVDEFCAESGGTAEEAFGPAREYAASLAASYGPGRLLAPDPGRQALRGVALLVGPGLLMRAVYDLVGGSRLPITLGDLLLVPAVAAVAAGGAVLTPALRRTSPTRRRALVVLAVAVTLIGVVAVLQSFPQVVFTPEPAVQLLIALPFLVPALNLLAGQLTGTAGAPIADPVTGRVRVRLSGRHRAAYLVSLLLGIVLPVLVAIGLIWVVETF